MAAASKKMVTRSRAKKSLSYAATESGNRRNAPRSSILSEDWELRTEKRKKLVATTLDQQRNFAIVGWMIRKHLDYVSRFVFSSQTGITKIDKRLELLWNNWAGRRKCDIARRHNLHRLMRLFETGKCIDGDAGILKVKGGYLQGIEGNRIAKPADKLPDDIAKRVTQHGLVLSDSGAVDKYVVCKRNDGGQLALNAIVAAEDLVFDGYFSRVDQTRGISPLAAAVNLFQDLYETLDYQLLKTKFHAMFGVAIFSDAVASGTGFGEANKGTANAPRYEFDLKPGLKLKLNPGDRIDTIESKTPSTEFQAFTEMEIQIALLALDIPLSFYNSIKANFSGRKQDWVQYDYSCEPKREANRECLWEIGEWRIPQLVALDPQLQRDMAEAGLTVDTLQWDFQAQQSPWIDEAAEINAIIAKIGAGLTSITRECKKRGLSAADIARERGQETRIFAQEGAPLTIGQPGQSIYAPVSPKPSKDQPNPDQPQEGDPDAQQNA